METIISSIITGAVAIVVCLITQGVNSSKTRSLIEFRLLELEKKQDKHNDVIERTYKLEEKTAVQEEMIKVANHRITDLENKVEGRTKK